MGKRKFWLIVIVLLIPIVPFLLMGNWLETLVQAWFSNVAPRTSRWTAGTAIIAGLVADIVLPIPSSVLLTFAGKCFGGWAGAAIGWVGLNLSAAVGFWTSRNYGQPIAERFSSKEDIEDFQWLDETAGWWSLIACRPLPILAEASVIFAGLSKMPTQRFWPPVIISNGVIALLYGLLGEYAHKQQYFGTAVFASMILPLMFVVLWRLWQTQRRKRATQSRVND